MDLHQIMKNTTEFLGNDRSLKDDIFIKPPDFDEEKQSAHAYASFGDAGMTASVNAYGHIMQMSRYLDFGRSGFLCVDSQYYRPYYVQARAEQLVESFKDPRRGLRLDILDWSSLPTLSFGFMYDRWPRYVINKTVLPDSRNVSGIPLTEERPASVAPDCPLSIQYYCFGDTIVQKYQILMGDNGITHNAINWGRLPVLPQGIYIRSLNFVDNLSFDQDADVNLRVLSDTSVIMVRAIPEDHFLEEEEDDQQPVQDPAKQDEQKKTHNSQFKGGDRPVAAALVVSPFINDQPAQIEDGTHIFLRHLSEETMLTVTIAYTVKLLYSDCQELFGIDEMVANADNDPTATPDTESLQRSALNASIAASIPESPTRSDRSTAKDAIDDRLETPVAGAEATLESVLASSVPSDPSPETSEESQERYEAIKAKEKLRISLKERDIADKWALEVSKAMQEMGKVFSGETTFRKICFSRNQKLDYVFRRNLEHILSVCSIPIPTKKKGVPVPLRTPAIVLSCGDIAGHRIGPRASLAAIQFLTSILSYVDPKNEEHELRYKHISEGAKVDRKTFGSTDFEVSSDTETATDPALKEQEQVEQRRMWNVYLSQLHERIVCVIKGHMVWICAKAEGSKLASFYPHHWPSGRRISNLRWLPPASLIDTPLQLLKLLCYLNKTRHLDLDISEYFMVRDWVQARLRGKARSWIDKLHSINERGLYAFYDPEVGSNNYFSDPESEADPKYRLTDHVMIGVAVKSIRRLWLITSYRVWPYYPYEEVRSKILKRFTVENPVSKQRMLAASRWKDKTRFLLHSKDSYLFSDEGSEFLGDSVRASERRKKGFDSIDPWRYADRRWARLLDAQAHHNHYQLMEWDNPLWYALVLILASKGTCVNNETAEHLMASCRSVLLNSASYNGLFPGQLGRGNMPKMFSSEYDRDNYWFRTFETTHILWSSRSAIDNSTSDIKASLLLETSVPASRRAVVKDAAKIGQQLENHYVFNILGPSSKNQMGVVAWSDDWLQAPPAFLDLQSKPITDAATSNEDWQTILGRVPRRPALMAGVIINVPKWSPGTEISIPQLASRDLAKRLDRQTVWESKKRIVWLPHCDDIVARRCFDVSSSVERESLPFFLARNLEREKYFSDNSSAELNSWDTELHLSFFGISDKEHGSLLRLESQSFLTSLTMSLRFSGDFSDRSWICYFLEPKSEKTRERTLGERLSPSKDAGIRVNLGLSGAHKDLDASERFDLRRGKQVAQPWQQRKVLELLIYSKMLEELRENTGAILRTVKRLALRSHNDEYPDRIFNSFKTAIEEGDQLQRLGEKEDYAYISQEWRRYMQTLLVVEENLIDNIEKIDQWEQREDERQSQQPRWTDRDRRNYYTTIHRLTILTQRQGNDIKRLRDDIRTFRDSLPNQLDYIREYINFRGSQNINLFTYVTIVFLPLGFGTGVLSMSGLPDHGLLLNFVYLSLGAFGFVLTLIILIKSQFFLKIPHWVLNWLEGQLLRYNVARQKKQDKNEDQDKDADRLKRSQDMLLQSSLAASTFGLPIAASLRPSSSSTSERLSQEQGRNELDAAEAPSIRSTNWRRELKKVLGFPSVSAGSGERKEHSEIPALKRANPIHETGKFSLIALAHRGKRKSDLEQGGIIATRLRPTEGSDEMSTWLNDFSGIDQSIFDDSETES